MPSARTSLSQRGSRAVVPKSCRGFIDVHEVHTALLPTPRSPLLQTLTSPCLDYWACSWTGLSSGISVTVAEGVGPLVSRCLRWTSRLSTEPGTSGQLSDPSQPQLPPVSPRCGKGRNASLMHQALGPSAAGSLTVLCSFIRPEPPACSPDSPDQAHTQAICRSGVLSASTLVSRCLFESLLI